MPEGENYIFWLSWKKKKKEANFFKTFSILGLWSKDLEWDSLNSEFGFVSSSENPYRSGKCLWKSHLKAPNEDGGNGFSQGSSALTLIQLRVTVEDLIFSPPVWIHLSDMWNRSVADIIVPELFRVLWLLLLFGFLWCSTSGSIYFKVREWILHTLLEPSMISITLVLTCLFNIKVFYNFLQCSCDESKGKTCLKIDHHFRCPVTDTCGLV